MSVRYLNRFIFSNGLYILQAYNKRHCSMIFGTEKVSSPFQSGMKGTVLIIIIFKDIPGQNIIAVKAEHLSIFVRQIFRTGLVCTPVSSLIVCPSVID